MNRSVPTNAALVIVDVQRGFDDPNWGARNNPQAEANIASLLALWRREQWPVIHIQHRSVEPDSPLRPELPGFEFKPEVVPIEYEPIFQKTVNSAFVGTELEPYLRQHAIDRLVIVGLTTDHCVSSTVRTAANLGFDVTLVSDGTATFDRTDSEGRRFAAEEVHAIHLASLGGEFCTTLTTQSVLSALGAGSA